MGSIHNRTTDLDLKVKSLLQAGFNREEVASQHTAGYACFITNNLPHTNSLSHLSKPK